jgi:hypothetical protein
LLRYLPNVKKFEEEMTPDGHASDFEI